MCQMFNHHKIHSCNHTLFLREWEMVVFIRYVTAFCVLPSFSQNVCAIDAFHVSLPSFNHFRLVGCALTLNIPFSLGLYRFLFFSFTIWKARGTMESCARRRTILILCLYRLTDDYYEPCTVLEKVWVNDSVCLFRKLNAYAIKWNWIQRTIPVLKCQQWWWRWWKCEITSEIHMEAKM